ncbi:hypothetical protein B0H34DRAFT_217681 [Crassisporium funariophilum]|nr:hypothetical protein B0H34DRAFT_217632 [Crassisporium funariophilum]KAF8164967.1 hypothetical protein B0H34DRAFT_217681 [Crassisporium funariophilum]
MTTFHKSPCLSWRSFCFPPSFIMHQAPSPPWGIPVNIPVPMNGDGPITHWRDLRFGPLGAYHLRCWLGVFPGIAQFFVTNQSRFRSSDIAWFASGMHRDGNHSHAPTSFHPSMVDFTRETSGYQAGKTERKALLTEVQALTFDLATMLDRLSGGTTIIIRCNGTMVPGAPLRPEFIKANVYIPPAFLAHNPDLHRPIMDLVQQYIETVGVRTVNQWAQRARNDLGYSLTQTGIARENHRVARIPTPEPLSAHYVFLGQRYRMIEDPSPALQAPSPASTDSYGFQDDMDAQALVIIDLQEKLALANDQNTILNVQAKTAQERIAFLEAQVRSLTGDASASTPVQNLPLSHSRATPQPTPLKHTHTPSRSRLARPETPESPSRRALARSPAPRTPETASRQSAALTPAFFVSLNTPSGSRRYVHKKVDGLDGPSLPSLPSAILPLLLKTYELEHLRDSIDIIARYTPLERRIEELVKIGVPEIWASKVASVIGIDQEHAEE